MSEVGQKIHGNISPLLTEILHEGEKVQNLASIFDSSVAFESPLFGNEAKCRKPIKHSLVEPMIGPVCSLNLI